LSLQEGGTASPRGADEEHSLLWDDVMVDQALEAEAKLHAEEIIMIDETFLHGDDYRVELPVAMAQHYKHIFELNDYNSSGDLYVAELSSFMESLGHGVSVSELEEMMHDVGISEDDKERITEAQFLEFIRRTLIADLPASKISRINGLFDELVASAVEKEAAALTAMQDDDSRSHGGRSYCTHGSEMFSPSSMGCIDKEQMGELLLKLGFHPDATMLTEIFDEVDLDCDGAITRQECLAAIGVLKQDLLELLALEESFTRFRKKARGDDAEDDHFIHVSDLVAALGVSVHEAEEIIFIADINENHRIDFTGFKQTIMNWTS